MGQNLRRKSLSRRWIHALDHLLCRIYGVHPFSDEPGIILRVQVSRLRRPIRHEGIHIASGSRVLLVHFWNERLPELPENGPDLGWAIRFQRSLSMSFIAVGEYLFTQPELQDVVAVGGETVLLPEREGSSRDSFLKRFGFIVFDHRSRLGGFGRFWENLYSWLLLWTYNPNSLRFYSFNKLKRREFWASRDAFLLKKRLPD